jgi:hypothetical protein
MRDGEKSVACKVVTKLKRVTTDFAKEPKEACPESQQRGQSDDYESIFFANLLLIDNT